MKKSMSTSIKRVAVTVGAGAFVLAVGIPALHADEATVEKRTEESHSYKADETAPVAAPAVVEKHSASVAEHTEEHTTERVAPPPVVEKRTTVETVPAAPVVQKHTTETVHTQD